MTKSKVGAEPKKQRIRHAVTKSEGIHEGIHRDEYGYYDSSYHCYCFAYGYFFHRGISLAVKLTPYYIKNNWVETSRGALVPLETAINIFNQLYVDYIISGKTEFQFKYNEFKIGSFCVSRASYVGKFTDINHYENPCENTYKDLGYKEWMFRIGCHTLWFDDIKDFARYYNLQDRLSFPLDRTTAECMENHLIHLPSERTIEAVGTMDI